MEPKAEKTLLVKIIHRVEEGSGKPLWTNRCVGEKFVVKVQDLGPQTMYYVMYGEYENFGIDPALTRTVKQYFRIKGSKRHMSVNIQGCLNNHKRSKITYFDNDDGTPMTDAEARLLLNSALMEGKKLIPSGDCYRFDFQKGCPGHIFSLKPNEETAAKIEQEYFLFIKN